MQHRSDAYLNQDIKNLLVSALHRAYDVNGRRYDEEVGDNATSFGTNVYHSTCHFLSKFLDELREAGELEISRPRNSFQIEGAQFTMHHYKYGENVDEIKFDQSATKIKIAEDNQYLLPLMPEYEEANARIDLDLPPFIHLVLAHSGTPWEGFREAYIGVPNGLGKDGISPWAWRDPVYLRGDGGHGGFMIEPIPGGPSPFTDIRMPDVAIRPRESEARKRA